MHEFIPSRRAFLTGSAATLLAAACGRATPPRQTTQNVQLFPTSIEHVVGDRRVAFAVFRGERPVRGNKGEGTLTLRDPDGKRIGPLELRTFTIAKGAGGEAQPDAPPDLLFVALVELASPGFYGAEAKVTIDGRTFELGGPTSRIGVADRSATVGPDQPGVQVATPTLDDARGVNPICTRKPPCSMHAGSLDAALQSGKPVVVSFGTPALCTSRMCGPVLDVIEAAKASSGEGIEFVHVEIYRDLTAAQEPTEGVLAWKIHEVGEPFTFFVAADGTVRERMSGPIGQWEVEEALGRLRA